ncbi:MAG TPA: SusC/RagA family TonB-linked outer membrane protein [Puia sp.]|nr:SusC/RagA family TonB-linked outer membrane protein [Puia sp.]
MNCLQRITLVLCLLTLIFHRAQAQAVQAGGIVRNETGQPIEGVTVQEKGLPGNGTVTKADGSFSLTLRGSSHTIVISYIGYENQEWKANGKELDIRLKESVRSGQDAVVIGYQSVKRRNLTAAVSSISGKDIQDIPEASFDQMLQGRLAGVSVLSSSGELGAKVSVVIRGATNVDYGNANGGNTGPLYVIDGVIYDVNTIIPAYNSQNAITGAVTTTNPLSLINPNEIESIDVLKDASAAAIYGARAGNGVIIVKTKRARRGKPQVTASAYLGATTHPAFRQVYTGDAERALKLDLLNAQLPYTSLQLGTLPIALTDSLNPAFNNDVDWQGLMIRNNALVNNEDIGVAGFSGSTSYRLSLNHYNEQGALNGFSVERFAPHLALGINPVKNLNIRADLLISSEKRRHGTGGSSGTLFSSWNFPSSFVQLSPAQQATFKGQANPFDDNGIFAMNASLGLTDTIAHNLLFNSTYSASSYSDRWDYFSPAVLNGVLNTAYDVNSSNPSWTFENYLTYMRSFNKSHLVLVGGVSAYDVKNYFTNASAAGIAVSGITTLQTVPPGTNLSVTTSRQEKTTVSYYGRLSYDYDGKYLATASLRKDASSIYSSSYQWGTFPSFSAGWIASGEDFFEPVKDVVNFFKLRASYGITGNDPGTFYAKYQSLSPDASYFGSTTGALGTGTNPSLAGVPSTYNGTTTLSPYPYQTGFNNVGVNSSKSVRWEKFPQWDVAADMEFFNSRINLSVDLYQKDALDKYFYNIPAQVTTGYDFYSGNFVNVRNQGIEIALATRNLSPKSAFQWNTTFNIAFNRNFVTKLPNGNRDFLFGPPWFQQSLTIGQPLFNYKVWEKNGTYATDADVPVDPITGKKMTFQGVPLQAGDARYVDINGDYNIDYSDKVIAGNPNPKATGGFGNTFTYKGISLNIFASFVLGRKIFNGYLSDALNGSNAYQGAWTANAGPASIPSLLGQFWTKPGDNTRFPRLVYPNGTAQDPWNIASSFFVEDGSFLKVKQVTLAYNLPEKWASRLHMRFINVYGMAENLLMLKKSKMIPDPELVDPTTGTANVVYPSALKLTAGFRVEF